MSPHRLIMGPVPERVIPATLLSRAMGDRYTEAKRTLARNGWFYMIGEDAWVCGWGMQPHEDKRPAPVLRFLERNRVPG